MTRKGCFGIIIVLLLMVFFVGQLAFKTVVAERRLGVKAGDWVKYEYVSIVVAGEHPWVKFEVQKVEGTRVTVLWTTGGPSGVSIPSGMPYAGLTVSWDVTTGASAFSYFIIHADAKVGDSVSIMGLLPLQIQGETTRTYAGVSRKVVYAGYSSFGLQNSYYWDKETGVLLEYSWTMGGVELTMKAVETNLWQAGVGGIPLWILGIIVALIVAVTIIIVVSLRRKPYAKAQSTAQGIVKQEPALGSNVGKFGLNSSNCFQNQVKNYGH